MTLEDKVALLRHEKYVDEYDRGIRDPFDPWFAKWKILLQVTLPLHYKQTSAELKRTFLMMKNRKSKSTIDIDEKLDGAQKEINETDKKNRLDAIKKKRETIDQSE
jgi:hypothetical protein